ncbi:MAG: hypothetical protein RLO52_02280 [Sandaracinaceae bacterium]
MKWWRSGSMVRRWVVAAVLERQKTFRRVRGFKGMPKLLDGLRQHDARLDRGVESEAHVA